ncbi:Hypothetical_protein [Hexamita inflata]|uniref:Hypothetical_protein n=1 Tax=Hexamita inflata TaxID=28002 RepID=A0AA86NMP0_9EUKA|nr:Hypothetical protein HINF_LOCUS9892 [Hexamita inflata]
MLLVQHKFLLREPQELLQKEFGDFDFIGVDYKDCGERAMKYRQRHTDSKKQISGTLLTDACFFNRKVVVDANGNKQNVIEFQYDDGTVEVKPINSGFVFLFIPLEEDWEPFLCFFQLHETGHASESDQPIAMDQMIKDLAKANFKVEITAWDGDAVIRDPSRRIRKRFQIIQDRTIQKKIQWKHFGQLTKKEQLLENMLAPPQPKVETQDKY